MNKRKIKELNMYFKLIGLNYYLIEDNDKIKIVIFKNG